MSTQPAIVLVHGFWGGAAHWSKAIVELARKGHTALHAVELPLTSLADDVERTRKMIDQIPGPVLLVGHSYGGAVITEAGNNHKSEDIVWLDYDSALSMHRVRNVPGEGRAKRLQTPTVADNRISFGCVNIPASFYDRYIDPLFSRTSGVVYVLPETKSMASVFPFATEGGAALASVAPGPTH